MMTRGYSHFPASGCPQRGTALIMSLIFLLLLTLIGITAMSTVTLEERMSGNLKDQITSFQSTESALRDSETDTFNNITTASPFSTACTNGLCTPAAGGTPAVWDVVNWGNASATSRQYGAFTGVAALTGVNSQPRYIVENLPPTTPPPAGESLSGGWKSGSTYQYYRITARGVGATALSQTMLQTTYRK